jgi:S1-C subfamily serine protease
MTSIGSPLSHAAFLLALVVAWAPSPAFADRAQPVEATVMIRVIGQVRVLKGLDSRGWRPKLLDLPEIEVGTGSGFIVSQDGWIVTNQHVISNERFEAIVEGEKLEVSIDVQRIEVLLPSSGDSQPFRRYVASVYTTDPEDDLAILHVGGSGLPYLGLGDSDAIGVGEAVSAVGYPYGRLLELAKPESDDALPAASVSTGSVSAFRTDGGNMRRLVQVTAPLNPGNSGGPIVDAEGYVVGVAQSRITRANAIGFGVPINRVKRLLALRGLDASLPVELLSAGPLLTANGKGVTIRPPAGYEDRSPVRLRLDAASASPARPSSNDTDSPEELALRIDRVATAQPMEQLERGLVGDGIFERFAGTTARRTGPPAALKGRALAGYATGTQSTTGAPWKIVYLIVDLGREKVVARYIGTADTIVANRSLLQASLAELEVSPLLTAEVSKPVAAQLTARATPAGVPEVEAWVVEPGLPWLCATGLASPSAGVAMSPPGDFTVALRATWHDAESDAPHAARQCSPQPGRYGPASYTARADAFGIAYQVEGVFVAQGDRGMWQLEVIAPVNKSSFLGSVFADWFKAIR